MMTLTRLRGYYVALVLADHAVWVGLSLAAGLVWQVSAGLEILRISLFGLALLPARFRLAQIRAVRWVSGYYFLLGAAGAWVGQAASASPTGFDADLLGTLLAEGASRAATGQSAWLLGLYSVLVLGVNARIIPRLRYL